MQGTEKDKIKPLERQGRDICSKDLCRQDYPCNEEANRGIPWESFTADVQIFALNLRPTAAASPLIFYFFSVCKSLT